jgi:hypothetical protein
LEQPRELLLGAYRDFNARDIDAVLARMCQDVVWPNGMEGGFVYGWQGIREYWTRQWKILDPHVDPVTIREDETGRWVVDVHQVVRDREGKLLLDTTVRHVYRIEDGLIVRMDIE